MNQQTKEQGKILQSDEEYVLISALTSTVTHGNNDWLVDSGASKHMTGYKESFINLSKHESPHKVKLGDDYQCLVKRGRETSYKLDSDKLMKMKDVLYILGLKKNLLSISSLDAKGFRVAFVDGQVLMWPRGKEIDDETIIGEQ